ncbi:DUF4384 domain-containing protein [Polyangium jinanense]|uniref:DUF4384 domain-containing protein n=1 Tax=Polyangium jinanense TaxID=2829994 RepID=A0A9X3X574_9BACT|nr:DUF4384 domain-containing protein [Polyangium jinanense]MDC3959912.1 DUF4384 domain-containing protein [Polyangium jinanense]MDC3983792.1 DUF4384 domain-containing protein [Polyangium jinanense]
MVTRSSAKGGTMKTKGKTQGGVKGAAKKATKSAAKAPVKGAGKAAKASARATKGSATAKVEARAKAAVRAAAVAPVDFIDEPPPSLTGRPFRRLAWGYALLSEMRDEAMNEFDVEAGTKVAIEGELDRLAYVYVVQIAAEDRSVEILYPPKGGARRMRPGTKMRIPGGSGWIVTTKKGKIRTIASSAPITDVTILGID